MAKLYYQGHGSYRITANDSRVIYVDPYAGDGYGLPADVILVTHQHSDHNQIKLAAKKPDCLIITNKEALAGGRYQIFSAAGIEIEAVEAKNKNHDPKECVGYIIAVDGITIYAAGDTSKTRQMEAFSLRRLDYALFPCDGFYNMGFEEAAECARLVGARHNIPIHTVPGARELFDLEGAKKWDAPNRLIIEPGEEIQL
jgi:L-ascorbate metabolism protein UlaG (beta-lactamase superfamily)